MQTQIIDGNRISETLYEQFKNELERMAMSGQGIPGLAVVMVGDDKASQVYVNRIIRKCESVGLLTVRFDFSVSATTEEVIAKIKDLNADATYSGILVQLPLPKSFDEMAVREAIAPEKDIDSAGSANIGKFYTHSKCYAPCTPKGMHRLLKSLNVDLVGLHAVVVGRSHVVGKPIADLLLRENMTVTVCHSKTKDLKAITRQGDVIMLGVGRANLLKADMIKEGAIVIDAGINVIDGKVCGDADYADLLNHAGYMTPVPGGVGPMTIAMLIENVMEACAVTCE
jgi:methylenetetrahydrofolate dehydrogenase (NADP+)/methenyltetrahydrofolate cyclohydrolase